MISVPIAFGHKAIKPRGLLVAFGTVLTVLTVLTADRMDTVNEDNIVRRQSSQHCPKPNAPAAGGRSA